MVLLLQDMQLHWPKIVSCWLVIMLLPSITLSQHPYIKGI
jgi:hypothetical protein